MAFFWLRTPDSTAFFSGAEYKLALFMSNALVQFAASNSSNAAAAAAAAVAKRSRLRGGAAAAAAAAALPAPWQAGADYFLRLDAPGSGQWPPTIVKQYRFTQSDFWATLTATICSSVVCKCTGNC